MIRFSAIRFSFQFSHCLTHDFAKIRRFTFGYYDLFNNFFYFVI